MHLLQLLAEQDASDKHWMLDPHYGLIFWTAVCFAITAIVLYEFGTGPIKGFAVTLSIGIVTSVFAALVITRALYDLYPGMRPVETVSI